ncbi:MAG: ABC transporter permease [Burkholderiales bacterium]
MLRLAFRNIFRNPLRTILTLAAVVTGVAAIVISGGFVEDVFVQLREATIHSQVGHLQISRKGYLELGRRDPNRYLIENPEIITRIMQAAPHVTAVMSRVHFSALANNGRADLPIVGEGVEPDKEATLGTATTLVAGRPLKNSDSFGVSLGEGVAAALKLAPGDPLILMSNSPEGALNTIDLDVVGVFRTFSKEYDDRAIRIPLEAAGQLINAQAVHSVVVLLDDTRWTDSVLSAVRPALEMQGYEIKPWYELADFYEKTVALYKRQFGALQFIILITLILSVTSTVNMAVFERTGEFGTLLAIGQPRKRIFRLVLAENSLLGVAGGVLGVLAGIALAVLVSKIGITMPPPPGSNSGYVATIRLVPWVLAASAITGTLATILATLLPARRAARLKVVDALRQNI